MTKTKTIQDYEKEIAELQKMQANATRYLQTIVTQTLPAKEHEVTQAKAAVKAKKDEILASTRQLREQLKALEKSLRDRQKEQRDLEAMEDTLKRQLKGLPRRIQQRQERVDELRKAGAPAPESPSPPEEKGDLLSLADAMKKAMESNERSENGKLEKGNQGSP